VQVYTQSESFNLESQFTFLHPSVDKQGFNCWQSILFTVVWGQSLRCLFKTNNWSSIDYLFNLPRDLSLRKRKRQRSQTFRQPLSTW